MMTFIFRMDYIIFVLAVMVSSTSGYSSESFKDECSQPTCGTDIIEIQNEPESEIFLDMNKRQGSAIDTDETFSEAKSSSHATLPLPNTLEKEVLNEKKKYLIVYEMLETTEKFPEIVDVLLKLPDGTKWATNLWCQKFKLPFYKLPDRKDKLYLELAKNDEPIKISIGFRKNYINLRCSQNKLVTESKISMIIDPAASYVNPDFNEIGIHSSAKQHCNPLWVRFSHTAELKALEIKE